MISEEVRETSRGNTPTKIDWLGMENEIRDVLQMFSSGMENASDCMEEIDDIIGWYTGRGYTLNE